MWLSIRLIPPDPTRAYEIDADHQFEDYSKPVRADAAGRDAEHLGPPARTEATLKDLETLRQAQLLLGHYGFIEEQEAVGKAIRIITATAKRLSGEELALRMPVASQGDRLKALRERAGLSRGQVAEHCGVILSTVRSHENSERSITPEAADAYAQALGTSRSMILYGRD